MNPSGRSLANRGRLLIISGVLLFGLSTLFSIVASLIDSEPVPFWVGGLDVALALVVVGLMIAIDKKTHGRIDDEVQLSSYHVYRFLIHLLILFLIVFFLFGNQIKWEILLPGLAWRLWVLLYILPAGLAIWKAAERKTTLLEG